MQKFTRAKKVVCSTFLLGSLGIAALSGFTLNAHNDHAANTGGVTRVYADGCDGPHPPPDLDCPNPPTPTATPTPDLR